jgi:ribosomal protein S18 acetylase RimI-like enzyme
MTAATAVVSAFPAGRGTDAAALVFEYMAATQAETGRAVPTGVGELPAVLRRECRTLQAVYRSPGAVLIADNKDQPAGCVGIASCSPDGAEVKRLYVRPAHRGLGIARILMRHAHHHAARHGMTRLTLDVLPGRTAVISFYRNLGYTEAEANGTESPVPMVCMERPITSDDVLPIDWS